MKLIRTPLFAFFAALLFVFSSVQAAAEDAQMESAEAAIISVNVNSASAEELAEKLDGIGAVRAAKIVEYREEHGPFTAVEQLLEVKGVGAATLEKNRAKILL